MPYTKTGGLGIGPPGALARPDWQVGGELTASALELELAYFRQRIRRHLRVIHGWGIICGLNVVPNAHLGGWNLFICPGYGIGPCGDEVFLLKALPFNLRDYLWMRPANSESDRGRNRSAHARIRHLLHQHDEGEDERDARQGMRSQSPDEVRIDRRRHGDQNDIHDHIRRRQAKQSRNDRSFEKNPRPRCDRQRGRRCLRR